MSNADEMKIGIRPGTHVDLIVSTDMLREKTDVRASTVYSTEGNRMVLAQTSPALEEILLGESIDITFLSGPEGRQVRMGLTATLDAFLKGYRLLSGDIVQAIVLTAESQEVRKYNLRMFHRVRPVSASKIKLYLQNREVPLRNISVGGLCYVSPFDARIRVGHELSARLEIGGTTFPVELKIVRIWYTPQLRRSELKNVSAEFTRAEGRMGSLLSGKILEIERELRSRGLD